MAPRLKCGLTGFFKPRFFENGALVRLGPRFYKRGLIPPHFVVVEPHRDQGRPT